MGSKRAKWADVGSRSRSDVSNSVAFGFWRKSERQSKGLFWIIFCYPKGRRPSSISSSRCKSKIYQRFSRELSWWQMKRREFRKREALEAGNEECCFDFMYKVPSMSRPLIQKTPSFWSTFKFHIRIGKSVLSSGCRRTRCNRQNAFKWASNFAPAEQISFTVSLVILPQRHRLYFIFHSVKLAPEEQWDFLISVLLPTAGMRKWFLIPPCVAAARDTMCWHLNVVNFKNRRFRQTAFEMSCGTSNTCSLLTLVRTYFWVCPP